MGKPFTEHKDYIKRKNYIIDAKKDEPLLRDFLLDVLYDNPRTLMPYVKNWCALTRDDWLLYMGCIAYEPLKNRDEEDCGPESSANWGRNGSFMLSESLFEELKEEYPNSKKLTYQQYQYLRFDDNYFDDVRNNHLAELQNIFTQQN